MRARSTFFIFAVVIRRSRSGEFKTFAFHSLTHSLTAGRARAAAARLHRLSSLSPSSPRARCWRRGRARARSGDAVWKVISVLVSPSLPLFLTLTERGRRRSTVKSQISNRFYLGCLVTCLFRGAMPDWRMCQVQTSCSSVISINGFRCSLNCPLKNSSSASCQSCQ